MYLSIVSPLSKKKSLLNSYVKNKKSSGAWLEKKKRQLKGFL